MLEALLQPCTCECEKHSGGLCGTGKARDLQQNLLHPLSQDDESLEGTSVQVCPGRGVIQDRLNDQSLQESTHFYLLKKKI